MFTSAIHNLQTPSSGSLGDWGEGCCREVTRGLEGGQDQRQEAGPVSALKITPGHLVSRRADTR